MDAQELLNIAFGIISVLAGWVFKMVWGRMKDLEDDLKTWVDTRNGEKLFEKLAEELSRGSLKSFTF